MDLVVLVRGHEEVLVAGLAGHGRRAGVRADQDGAGIQHGFGDRAEDVGEHRADDEVDLAALDEAAHLADRDIGLQLVVDDGDLHRHAAELAAVLVDRELEAVANLLAEGRRRPGQHADHADLQRFLRLGGRKPEGEHAGAERQCEFEIHV